MNVKRPENPFKRKIRSRCDVLTPRMLGALAFQVLLAWQVHADAAWLDSGWPNRRRVTVAGALASETLTNLTAQLRGLYIGRYASANYAFNGRVDELRISGVAHTPEWIKACYLSQNEPGASLSFEPPEFNVSVGTLISIH